MKSVSIIELFMQSANRRRQAGSLIVIGLSLLSVEALIEGTSRALRDPAATNPMVTIWVLTSIVLIFRFILHSFEVIDDEKWARMSYAGFVIDVSFLVLLHSMLALLANSVFVHPTGLNVSTGFSSPTVLILLIFAVDALYLIHKRVAASRAILRLVAKRRQFENLADQILSTSWVSQRFRCRLRGSFYYACSVAFLLYITLPRLDLTIWSSGSISRLEALPQFVLIFSILTICLLGTSYGIKGGLRYRHEDDARRFGLYSLLTALKKDMSSPFTEIVRWRVYVDGELVHESSPVRSRIHLDKVEASIAKTCCAFVLEFIQDHKRGARVNVDCIASRTPCEEAIHEFKQCVEMLSPRCAFALVYPLFIDDRDEKTLESSDPLLQGLSWSDMPHDLDRELNRVVDFFEESLRIRHAESVGNDHSEQTRGAVP